MPKESFSITYGTLSSFLGKIKEKTPWRADTNNALSLDSGSLIGSKVVNEGRSQFHIAIEGGWN